VAPRVLRIVAAMSESPGGAQHVDEGQRIIAEKIVDARGTRSVVVVCFPAPSILSRSLFDLLAADLDGSGVRTGAMVRLLAVLTVAGVLCFVLARHLASPINRLRSATRAIANEQLQTRVDKRVLGRRDELADLGRDFDRMAERIEHLVTAQRQLLADVSHALRSPLARLNVALGLARRRSEPATSEHLDRIERETERLNTLIGQLLTMARVSSGVDLERREVFDLGGIVDEVAVDAAYEARDRHCRVQFDQRREYLVEGARDVLRSAVENVVRNAVHYTAESTSVDISMDCLSAHGKPRAVIQVRDHGPGVPREAVSDLFTPFFRVTNDSHGTGLGLAIARRAFEVHGGTATATNAVGGGLVVNLEMPLYVAVAPVGSRVATNVRVELEASR
jgi:two-component system sensor histidine kinase CpxA